MEVSISAHFDPWFTIKRTRKRVWGKVYDTTRSVGLCYSDDSSINFAHLTLIGSFKLRIWNIKITIKYLYFESIRGECLIADLTYNIKWGKRYPHWGIDWNQAWWVHFHPINLWAYFKWSIIWTVSRNWYYTTNLYCEWARQLLNNVAFNLWNWNILEAILNLNVKHWRSNDLILISDFNWNGEGSVGFGFSWIDGY